MGKDEPRESTALSLDGKTPVGHLTRELWAVYDRLVATWAAKLNLIGAKDAAGRRDVLFADAEVLVDEALVPHGARLIDIGSGVGAPLLPVLLARPDLSAVMMEPRRNRVAFLRTAIGTLDLMDRCEVREERLEHEAVAGAPFDLALSRATFAPDEWLRRAAALAPRAIVMVAGQPLPEGDRLLERQYALAASGAPRALGLYRV